MRRVIHAFPAALAGFFLFAWASAASALLVGQDLSSPGSYQVETIEFRGLMDGSRNRNVPIKVHLPVAKTGSERLPVVLVSHGAGGSWDANYAQARHLATHGYVVLALEHVGSNTQALLDSGLDHDLAIYLMTRSADEVLGRPKDVSFAIDKAVQWNSSHKKLKGRMNLDKIGILGHSFGAYTVLASTGMRPALDWLNPPQGSGLAPSLRDKRIDCGVALSPQGPGEPFFLENRYGYLKTPTLGITGSKDVQQGALPWNRRRAFELWPAGDKYLAWLNNAEHSAFSDSTGSGLYMPPSESRADAQPIVRVATLLFFNVYLKNDANAKRMFNDVGLSPYLKGVIDDLEFLSK